MVCQRLPVTGNVTGTPAHVRKTARALAARGMDVRIVELQLDMGAAVHRAAVEVIRAWRTLARLKPAVIHAHGHVYSLAVLPLARALRIPVVCEVHGLYVPSKWGQPGSRPLLSRLAKATELYALRSADHIVAQASAMAQRIVADAKVPRGRITVLYPGLDTREFSGYTGPRDPLPEAGADKVVMYVGSTHGYQGLELLARVQRTLPGGFRVVLVLSNDGSTAIRADELGFEPQRTVVLTSARSGDLPALLARADVLVHTRPACPENINVQSKLGVYLASGRPVVTTDVGDYADLLRGCAGAIAVPPDPALLGAAIQRAATDPVVSNRARGENVRVAERFFESASNAQCLVELYAALHASPRSRA